jgi:hypothetical protein
MQRRDGQEIDLQAIPPSVLAKLARSFMPKEEAGPTEEQVRMLQEMMRIKHQMQMQQQNGNQAYQQQTQMSLEAKNIDAMIRSQLKLSPSRIEPLLIEAIELEYEPELTPLDILRTDQDLNNDRAITLINNMLVYSKVIGITQYEQQSVLYARKFIPVCDDARGVYKCRSLLSTCIGTAHSQQYYGTDSNYRLVAQPMCRPTRS